MSDLFTSIVKLPYEISTEIFSHLDISSILALRASNHFMHDLIYRHESDIVRAHFKNQLPASLLTVFPNPDTSNPWTLDYLCETLRRQRTCQRLAAILSDAMCARFYNPPFHGVALDPLRPDPPFERGTLHPRIKERCVEVRPRLALGLYVLYDFLSRLKTATLKCTKDLDGVMSDEDFTSLTQCLSWDQQTFVWRYPPELTIEAHHIFCMLGSVISHQLSYQIELKAAIKKACVMGGLDAIERFLRPAVFQESPARVQLAFGKGLGRGLSPPKLSRSIRHLNNAYRDHATRDGIKRSTLAIGDFICSQSVWFENAEIVIQRREIHDQWAGNEYQYMDHLIRSGERLEKVNLTINPFKARLIS